MANEEVGEGAEEIVMKSEEASPGRPVDKNQEYVKKMLGGCLKHGLTALCKEKPDEPIKWLAHWLLEHNPNQPRVSWNPPPAPWCYHFPALSRAHPPLSQPRRRRERWRRETER